MSADGAEKERGNASGRATRELLARTAERLFSSRGITAVSLREVGQAAGQRNNAATQYHFRDRAGLVRAVFQLRVPEINERRHAMLAELDRHGRAHDPLALIGVLVRSAAELVPDDDNHYVGFFARFQIEHGGQPWESDQRPWQDMLSSYHMIKLALRKQTSHLSHEVFEHRFRLISEWYIYALAQVEEAARRHRFDLADLDSYCADLTLMLWAALSAPCRPASNRP